MPGGRSGGIDDGRYNLRLSSLCVIFISNFDTFFWFATRYSPVLPIRSVAVWMSVLDPLGAEAKGVWQRLTFVAWRYRCGHEVFGFGRSARNRMSV